MARRSITRPEIASCALIKRLRRYLPKCLGKLIGRGQVSHILYSRSSHSQNAGLLSTRSNLFEKAAMLTQYTAVLAFLVALFASVVKCQIGLRS